MNRETPRILAALFIVAILVLVALFSEDRISELKEIPTMTLPQTAKDIV